MPASDMRESRFRIRFALFRSQLYACCGSERTGGVLNGHTGLWHVFHAYYSSGGGGGGSRRGSSTWQQ